jgi:hypothetical protein
MSNARSRSDLPSTSELVEGSMFCPIALVASATVCPGLTLCIPGLILVTALVLIPLVAMAIVVLLAAAVLAVPVVLVRVIRGLGRRRAASKPQSRVAVDDLAARIAGPDPLEGGSRVRVGA